ncbi:MAG: hypothetical protein PF795_14320 [Kiritimatiellae bacterium]|jgi:hypothetical protein|nr:hypothetical protein [Kiritimatiellia bacterium]
MKEIVYPVLLIGLFCGGCTLFQSAERPLAEPAPPALGIVRFINQPEHYLIFEAQNAIPAGTRLVLLREGRRIGSARVGSQQNRTFQTADILEGAPSVGDVVQPRSLVP